MNASQPTNDLAATLDDGNVAFGILDNTYSPTLIEFYCELGLDFVCIDLEHGGPDPWNAGQIEDLPPSDLFWTVALLVGGGGIVALLASPFVKRLMGDIQ